LEPLKNIIMENITCNSNSGKGLRSVEAHSYENKSVDEIQKIVKTNPLIVNGKATEKMFDAPTLAELQPLAMPIEVSGKRVILAQRTGIIGSHPILRWTKDARDLAPRVGR